MSVVAIVPAAGAGRRLGGVCKALLLCPDGRTFLETVAASARAAGATEIIVVIAEPFGLSIEAALPPGVRAVWNPLPERGMAASIACGLSAAIVADVALIWPVDHPFASPDSARAVLAAAAGPAAIAIPTYQTRGGHPTAFGRDLWPELEDAASAADGARSVIHRDSSRVVRVPVDDPGVLKDVDLPGDRA